VKKGIGKYLDLFKKSLFYNSFKKLDLRILLTAGYEICFFILTVLILKTWSDSVINKGQSVIGISIDQIAQMAAEEAKAQLAALKHYAFFFIGSLILAVILIYLLYCLTYGLIWTSVLNKKFTARYFRRFALFNLVYFFILLLTLLATALVTGIMLFIVQAVQGVITNQIVIGILFLPVTLFVYIPLLILFYSITSMAYLYFTKGTPRLFGGIAKAFGNTFTNRIVPLYKSYVWMAALLIVVSQLFWFLDYLPDTAGMIIGAVILMLYLAWTRFYLADVVEIL
jgi:hypothetical protein